MPLARESSSEHVPLTVSVPIFFRRYVQDNLRQEGDDLNQWTFEACLDQITSTMIPSPLLLRFLCAIREYNTLAEAAARLLSRLPASSHLAAGISALAQYSKR